MSEFPHPTWSVLPAYDTPRDDAIHPRPRRDATRRARARDIRRRHPTSDRARTMRDNYFHRIRSPVRPFARRRDVGTSGRRDVGDARAGRGGGRHPSALTWRFVGVEDYLKRSFRDARGRRRRRRGGCATRRVLLFYTSIRPRGARARQSASDDGVNDASGRRRRRFKRHDKDE